MPMWNALAHSLNTVAARLTQAIGDGDWKRGRARITATAHRLGVTAPLPDTQSLPLGADDVRVMDQATAYSAFANGGKRIKPFAALEIFNSRGDIIYNHERDGEQPQQVIEQRFINDLVWMMTQVVEQGTGRRAALDGIKVAGKTGTTNGYKDAWFCGYTGNFVGVVWYGNDDDQPMENMTGGTLPAMTWHDIMQFAHSGVELKPLPGSILPQPEEVGPIVQLTTQDGEQAPRRREQLSKKSSEALGSIETLMKATAGRRVDLDLPHRNFASAPGGVVDLR
jgi:penicillin-binding protein 1A